ncbi:cupin domain-containing protein [Bacillus sp. FJAT-49711]|uniref:sugar phosphate nucleotidyltransferase n=1 Tax=Bacillus sp. FJAT-49711 TaxID=2833585 RepID=UPI001BC8CFA0|nr:sugar phosphate nucleotidyltransferase [Bacillus sp. FJAT-49711]MBS4218988.1 cupin domain-containing protein [Bacillus sp. FJAT-49711]
MKLVLLSGGSGKRLWPLSNDSRSKQFLKVLEGDNGEKQSMLQRVWKQLNSVNLSDETIIATSKLQKDIIQSQIGTDVPLITEPERRDTFPAIALAVSYLYSVEKVSDDEVISILPVDPYVENSFFEKVKELEGIFRKSDCDLALIGVNPTYPSSKYGYIVQDKDSNTGQTEYYNVSHFTEKPTEEEAKNLISMNALWNCGVFAFKSKYVIDILIEKGLPTDFETLLNQYDTLPSISFDYEVVEKANRIIVLPYSGKWKDLGTWNTLTEETASNQIGSGIISEDAVNTHLVNELSIPITILGIQNAVIAASPDGILVTDKSASPRIKDFIKVFDNRLPMYEERLWGWSRVLDYEKYTNGNEMITKRICIHRGKNSSYHSHLYRDEVWTIVKGEGELALEGNITKVKAGDNIHLPANKKHGIRAITDLEFIEVQTGNGLSDDDFSRLYFDWDEMLNSFKKSKVIL